MKNVLLSKLLIKTTDLRRFVNLAANEVGFAKEAAMHYNQVQPKVLGA